jgi:dTDP-4-amino-4,6-dideoxygalactose transaminase
MPDQMQKQPLTLSAPEISLEDRQRVFDALADPRIAYGPTVEEFERCVADFLGLRAGVATISGTAALHLAMMAVGVRPGDVVLVPSLTFVAPANAARYAGAEPLLFDSEPTYRQLDVDRLGAWLRDECQAIAGEAIHTATGRRIGAVVAVDLLGHPCDVARLAEFTRPLGVPIVEDGAQALGASQGGRPIGGASKALCLSFNANKIITSGGGGMLLSDDVDLLDQARFLANQAKQAGPDYVHPAVGFNYRLPTAQAALGLSQFGRLQSFVERKRRVARRYVESLAGIPGLTTPNVAPDATSTHWLFAIQLDDEAFGLSAAQLREHLWDRELIETRSMFCPLHLSGVHAGLNAHDCGVAERLGASGLILPSSVALTDPEIFRVCEAIRAASPD